MRHIMQTFQWGQKGTGKELKKLNSPQSSVLLLALKQRLGMWNLLILSHVKQALNYPVDRQINSEFNTLAHCTVLSDQRSAMK